MALVLEVRARAAQGRFDEVDRLLDLAETLSPETYWSAGAAAVVGAEAARAHGHDTGWTDLLARGGTWLDTRLSAVPEYRSHRYWRASVAYDAREWTEARERFGALLEEVPDNVTYRGMTALAAGHAGDTATARALLVESFPGEPGEHTAYRARLAALRGDADETAALLGLAFAQGVGGWAWIHESGYDDFAPVASDTRIARLVPARF